jgi:hypothetical protein
MMTMTETEGAASTITPLPDGYVRKTTKRSARKSHRHDAATQLAFHRRLYDHLSAHPTSPFMTPHPRPSTDGTPHSYEMAAIDVTATLQTREELLTELTELETAVGFQFFDCEFFRQPDGRIAIIDMDQVRPFPI